MKKPGLIQETMSIRKSRQRERIQGGKREKRGVCKGQRKKALPLDAGRKRQQGAAA